MKSEKTIRFAIYVVLLCAIYWLGYREIFNKVIKNELVKKKTELYAYSKILKEQQETLDEFNKLAASYKNKREIFLKINESLLDKEKRKLEIINFFSLVAAKSGVSVEVTSFGELKQGGEKVGALPVNINVKGNYQNLKNFIGNLSLSLPLSEVETLSLPALGGDKIDSYSMQVIIYTENVPAPSPSNQNQEQPKEQNENQITQPGGQNF